MAEEQITSESEPQRPLSPRVALIASPRIVADYSGYLKYLLVGLADEGVPVLLVCPPRFDIESIVSPAVEVVRHPAIDIPLLESYNLKLLFNRLKEFQPGILHCLCETKAALTRRLARRLDVPYLLNINSISKHLLPPTISKSRCAAIVAPASTIAEHFAAAHPKLAQRVRQINIGTFVESATTCFAHPERLPGIVVAHPLERAGDLDNLFQAFHRLSVDKYEFIVALIGTRTAEAPARGRAGHAEKHLRKLLGSLGLLRIVTVIPQLSGLSAALAAADIFVVPRPSFSFNMLLLSAMSVGSAVAASTGGVDDLIIDGKTALTFNPDDQISIYNALKRLFDMRDLARQIAASAQQHLRQNHHVSDMVASIMQLYRQSARLPLPQAETSAA